jgi:hypothetical protein
VDEKELRVELRGPAQACKFEKLPEFWTWVEETYGELGMRALCLEDRFYLLTQACGADRRVSPVAVRALP